MKYELIFDISQTGLLYFLSKSWVFIVIPVFLVGWGLMAFHDTNSIKISKPIKVLFLLFFIIVSLYCIYAPVSDYLNLRSSLMAGKCNVAEGAVTDFVPMSYSGHNDEHFKVQGVDFSYSDYGLQAGFNRTQSHGSPIKEGLKVKICYLNDLGDFPPKHEIAKLEIAE